MLPTPHAATGAAIVVAGSTFGPVGLVVGTALAFFSHWPLDLLGERPYKGWMVVEGIALLFLLAIGYVGGFLLPVAIGMVAGLGMDLIDKKLGLTLFFPDKLKPTYYFHPLRFREYVKPLTEGQTFMSVFLFTVVLFFTVVAATL